MSTSGEPTGPAHAAGGLPEEPHRADLAGRRRLSPFSGWPPGRWLAALAGGAATALLVGVPTGVVRTPFYTRMTPVLWWNYPVWAVTAVLGGLIVTTYLRRTADTGQAATSVGGGVLSAFAVGCPVCNKLVVALLGVSGALTVWAPVQPVLGVASVALLGVVLRRRLAGVRASAVSVQPGLEGSRG